jgi:outer membrane receptor protein involved in Fe transport
MGLAQDGDVGAVPYYNVANTGDERRGLLTTIIGNSGNSDKLMLASGTLAYEFDFATLTAVSAYTKRDNFVLDAVQLVGPGASPGSSMTFGADTKSWTFETRLVSGDTGAVQWLIGAYAFSQNRASRNRQSIGFGAVAVSDSISDSNTDEIAAFGELTYRPIAPLSLTAGLRYSGYRNGLDRVYIIAPPGGQALGAPRYKEDSATFKGQVSYRVSEDVFTYVVVSQGFRPGGFNPNASPGFNNIPVNFNSDALWNYEAGAKTSWLERRLTVNAAAYRIDWSNMQVQGFTPAPIGPGLIPYATNASGSQIYGFELEAQARPSDAISVDFAFNHFFKNELTRDAPVSPSGLAPKAGDPLSFNPQSSFNLGMDYRHPIGDDFEGFARIEWSYVGRRYTGFRPILNNGQTNFFFNNMAPYNLVNVRAGVASGRWRATVFVDNLTDSRPALRQENIPGAPPTVLRVTARPRTIGVTVSAKY